MKESKALLGVAIAVGLALIAMTPDRHLDRLAAVEGGGHDTFGHHAEEPTQIRFAGWWAILKRVFYNIGRDNVSLMAAGIGFYALLSLTPAFTAVIALYGLMFDVSQVQIQLQSFEGTIPEEARRIIADQLTAVVQGNPSNLGVGLVLSLGIALWSANSATSALMAALNVAYSERERRNPFTYYATSLALTAFFILFGIVSLALVAVIPAVVGLLPLGEFGKWVIAWSRWPLLIILSTFGLAIIYRFAPSRNQPRWSWVSPGAVGATILWIIGSALFSIYVEQFASYNKTYGSLGAVVILLMWFWLSAYAVLLGAELNAETELQTSRDTTEHPEKPMGQRGAYVADTVAL